MSHITGIFAIVLLAVVGTLFLPSLMDVSSGEQRVLVLDIDLNETESVTDELNVRLDDINGTSDVNVTDTANITLIETTSLTEVSQSNITVGSTVSFGFNGDTPTVTLDSITSDSARITVEYDPHFGWDDGARTLSENLAVVWALLLAMAVIGGVRVALQ